MSEFTIEELSDAPCKVAGQKQVLAALENGQAEFVFVAENADGQIRRLILQAAEEEKTTVIPVATMEQLGAAAGIRVEATCAAIIREKTSSPKGCKGDFKIYQDK